MSTHIRYLTHDEIDKAKWDQSLPTGGNGAIYAQSWYLDMVSPHWDALVSEDYSLLMPLTWRKKYGVKYLYQPPFTQQLGLYSSSGKITSSQVKEFIGAIPASFRYLDIFINSKNQLAQGSFPGLKIKPRLTHHLSMEQDYTRIRKDYSTNLSRNLKKASANEFKVIQDFRIDELISLFRKNRGQRISTMGSKEFNVLRQLAETAFRKKAAFLYGIQLQGKLVAGALFLSSGYEHVFLFSATGPEGKKNGAMSLVIDRFIQDHCTKPGVLDFEGSMDKNLSRFYKSFGADEIVYLHIQLNRLPGLVRWLKK